MKLSVHSIQNERGAKVYSEFKEDVSGMDSDGELIVRGPAYVQVTATNLGERIGLEGRLQLPVRLVCSRCMQGYDVELDEPIEEFFARGNGRGPRGKQLSELETDRSGEDETDTFDPTAWDERAYEGNVIELDDILRETVLLAVPMKPVCREDCRGLCPVCGHNLNEGDCGCDQRQIDPRLAGLARWFDAEQGPSNN